MTPVSITRNGVTYTGHYRVSGGMVHVSYEGGTKSTQVGGSTHEAVAQMLLGEMISVS